MRVLVQQLLNLRNIWSEVNRAKKKKTIKKWDTGVQQKLY